MGYDMGYVFTFDDTLRAISFHEIEILKRRSTRKKKCIDDTTGYDRRILSQYVLSKGCKLPYIVEDENLSVCHGAKKLNKTKFEYAKISFDGIYTRLQNNFKNADVA